MKPASVNDVAIAILELEMLGYRFTLGDRKIHFSCEGNRPAIPLVQPHLEIIRANRDHAVTYLQNRRKPYDLAAYLLEASDRIAEAARSAEAKGDIERARREWRRFARFYAAYADEAGIESSTGESWQAWAEDCGNGTDERSVDEFPF